MNIVLGVLAGLAVFILILFLAALFIKKEFTIMRTIVINKSKQEVFDYLRFLKNQEKFSKWVMTDPNMKKEFRGTDGTIGCVYAWDSENKQAGKGEQEIIGLTNGEKIDVEVRFEKPFKNTAKTPFTVKAFSNHQTEVTWGMISQNKYPINLINSFMAGILGKDLEISLNNLKTVLETK